MLAALLEGSSADFTRKFPELVVVPDGVLWYLPFEALTVKVDGQLQPLISRFRVRYAPTMSLAVPDGRGRTLRPETLVVAGRLHPHDDFSVAQAAFQQIVKAIPLAVAADKGPLPACSALFKVRAKELIVLDDLGMADLASYAWSPITIDRGKPGNSLGDWLGLPWGGPEVVILPGLQTPAGSGFKRNPRMADGSDLFLAVCGLLTTGTRTALLSRWRTGGQSAIELVSEFAQELPNTTPADAWQRAVLLLAESRLNPEAEPRVKKPAGDEPLKGDHPFFWAGYMLVDPGDLPVKGEAGAAPKPGPGAEKPKAPEQPPGPAKPAVGGPVEKPEPPADPEPSKKAEPAKKPEPAKDSANSAIQTAGLAAYVARCWLPVTAQGWLPGAGQALLGGLSPAGLRREVFNSLHACCPHLPSFLAQSPELQQLGVCRAILTSILSCVSLGSQNLNLEIIRNQNVQTPDQAKPAVKQRTVPRVQLMPAAPIRSWCAIGRRSRGCITGCSWIPRAGSMASRWRCFGRTRRRLTSPRGSAESPGMRRSPA